MIRYKIWESFGIIKIIKNRTGEWSFKYVFDKEKGFVEWRIEYNQTTSIHLTLDKIIPR